MMGNGHSGFVSDQALRLAKRRESKMKAMKIARGLIPAFGAITVLAFAAPGATLASTSSPTQAGVSPVAGSAGQATISSSAARADTAAKHHYTWKVKIRHHKVTKGQQAAIARAAHSRSGGSSCGVMNRTNNCGAEGLSLTLIRLDDGVPDGTEEWLFAAVDYIGTRWNSKTFSDAMAVVGLSREGDDFISEPTISVTAICPCSSTNAGIIMAGPLTDALAGSLHHTAHVGTGQILNATPEYDMTGSAEGGSGGITWFGDSEVRCDHVFAIAGCVFPEYWPTVNMSGLPHIAPHILLVEGRGAHLGNAAYFSPLSKGTGRQQARNNRRQVCHGKPPKKGWSCDEYPFASTAQGGTSVAAINRSTAWVPRSENSKQGGILGSFYKINRLLPHDKFFVAA
jgi:hypothetical protein